MYVRVYKTRTKAGSRVVLRSRRNCRRRDGLIALRESATSRVATPLCAKGELVTEGGGGEWERFEINECRSYFDQVRRTRLMERRVQFFFFFSLPLSPPFRCRCDRPSSINSDCKTTTRTGVPLDTCINNTRHSVFFERADWFLYFSVLCRPLRKLLGHQTGFSILDFTRQNRIFCYTYTRAHTCTKGRSLILDIRLFIFATRFIYTRVPFTGYFSTFEEER